MDEGRRFSFTINLINHFSKFITKDKISKDTNEMYFKIPSYLSYKEAI